MYVPLNDCVEMHFQRRHQCVLPWNERGGRNPSEECHSPLHWSSYVNMSKTLFEGGDHQVTLNTGCITKCNYAVKSAY